MSDRDDRRSEDMVPDPMPSADEQPPPEARGTPSVYRPRLASTSADSAPTTIEGLMSDQSNEATLLGRVAQRDLSDDGLKAEIRRMANVVLKEMRAISKSPGDSPAKSMMKDKMGKWSDLHLIPSWLDNANNSLLKILLADAYWDYAWVRMENT